MKHRALAFFTYFFGWPAMLLGGICCFFLLSFLRGMNAVSDFYTSVSFERIKQMVQAKQAERAAARRPEWVEQIMREPETK